MWLYLYLSMRVLFKQSIHEYITEKQEYKKFINSAKQYIKHTSRKIIFNCSFSTYKVSIECCFK